MRLSFLAEQLVRSSEQLVLVDTKKGFLGPGSMDEYGEEKRREKNLIVRSGISEAETTNNKRLRSTFCRDRHEASRGLFATAELLVNNNKCPDIYLYLYTSSEKLKYLKYVKIVKQSPVIDDNVALFREDVIKSVETTNVT